MRTLLIGFYGTLRKSSRWLMIGCTMGATLLSGCSSLQEVTTIFSPSPQSEPRQTSWEKAPQGGGYYQDDGPGSHRPIDLLNKPDALPKIEPLAVANTRPYTVMGQNFTPQTSLDEPYIEEGFASWYGRKFHGAKTANGEIYDMYEMTAAHPTLSLPSYAKVTNLENGKSVTVRVNDRGPFLRGRIIDLSYAAALKLDYIDQGSARVRVEKLTPTVIARLNANRSEVVAVQTNSENRKNIVTIDRIEAVPVGTQAITVATSQVTGSVQQYPVISVVSSGNSVNPLNSVSNVSETREIKPVVAIPVSVRPVVESPRIAVPTVPSQGIRPQITQPSVAVTAIKPISGESLLVQLGAFSQQENAIRLLTQVQTQYPQYGNTLEVVFEQDLYRVMVGPFQSQETANQALLVFSVDSQLTPIIKKNLNMPQVAPSAASK